MYLLYVPTKSFERHIEIFYGFFWVFAPLCVILAGVVIFQKSKKRLPFEGDPGADGENRKGRHKKKFGLCPRDQFVLHEGYAGFLRMCAC